MASELMGEVQTRDVMYLDDELGQLGATLYVPAGPGPWPCVLDVHGGAWVGGSRFGNKGLDRAFAAQGYLVLAVDFRQPPAHPYPASVEDTHAAIRWFKAHAAELGGDPARGFVVVGTSSGGHLALMATLRPQDAVFGSRVVPGAAEVDATADCVLACWPITDPAARYAFAQQTGRDDL